MLSLLPVPAFRDNYIWLLYDASGHCLIVDPGDAAVVEAALAEHRLTPSAILVTHHHPDHTAGITTLLARHPVPVYGPAAETIPGRSHALQDGDRIRFAAPAVSWEVMSVPGHTLGHIAYLSGGVSPPLLLAGDTLFSGGCGRLFEGTPAQMLASLDRFAALPEQTLLLCTHEYTVANLLFARSLLPDDPAVKAREGIVAGLRQQGLPSLPSTLAEEKRSNLFLRCDDPTVAAAVQPENKPTDGIMEPFDRLSVFTALRARKDHF
ncbi:MAG: hydroxyacylglutathione hydrolase [Alcanivoracaceae bacterium]